MRFSDYEELTEYDDYLTRRYQDPSNPAPYAFPDDSFATIEGVETRPPAPAELIREVSRAYFHLAQDNEIAAWFEAAGFDLTRPTLPKEEFEKRFAGYRTKPATVLPKISKAKARDFVIAYFNSTTHPTSDDCESKWPHGSRARELLRNEYRAEAEKRGIPVKEGRRQKLAK